MCEDVFQFVRLVLGGVNLFGGGLASPICVCVFP